MVARQRGPHSESVPGRGLRHAVAACHITASRITARLGLNRDPRLWHQYIIDAWCTEFAS